MRNSPPLTFHSLRTKAVQISLAGLALLSHSAMADVYDEVERLIRNGQLERAAQISAGHLKQRPQDPQMRLLESRILEARGQAAEAIAQLESMALEFPELPEPHNNLAVLYARSGRIQEALESLNRALLARPDYAVALENQGDLHLLLALQSYQQASRTASATASAARKAQTIAPMLQQR